MAKGNFTVQVGNRTDGTTNEYIKVWWESTPDAANNRSKVRVYAKMYRPRRLDVDGNRDIELWINGEKFTATRYGWSGKGWTKAYIDKSVWVTHKNDGTKSIKIRLKTQVKAQLRSYVGWVDTGNKTIQLDKLAQKSSFTLDKTSASLGDTIKLALSRSSTSVRHKISLQVGDYTKIVLEKTDDNGTSTLYPIPMAAYQILPYMDGKTAIAKITVTTYDGSSSLGTTSKKVTLSLRDGIDGANIATDGTGLIVEAIPISPNILTSHYIQLRTNIKITINATATSGTAGTIKEYIATFNSGNSISNQSISSKSNTIITDSGILKPGTWTISAVAIDGRGMKSNVASTKIEVLPYFEPFLSEFSALRCLSDGTLDKTGDHIKVTFNYNFADCDGNNNAVISLRERNSIDSSSYVDRKSWTINNSDSSDGTGTITEVLGTYSVDNSFNFELEIIDSFYASSTIYTDIGTEELLIDLSPNSVAVGKVAERENALEVGWDAHFEGAIYGTVQANTSDIRKKILIDEKADTLLDIWDELSVVLFKYRDGDEKILPGLVAQDVISIFNAHELDWRDYGMVYEDPQTGFYSINYEFVNQLSMLKVREVQDSLADLAKRVCVLEIQACPLMDK